MRKSFAHCEAFGLNPFASPWIPSAREGLSAGKLSPTQPSVAERPSAPWTPLRAAQCKCRYGLLREGHGWRTTATVRYAPVARP